MAMAPRRKTAGRTFISSSQPRTRAPESAERFRRRRNRSRKAEPTAGRQPQTNSTSCTMPCSDSGNWLLRFSSARVRARRPMRFTESARRARRPLTAEIASMHFFCHLPHGECRRRVGCTVS